MALFTRMENSGKTWQHQNVSERAKQNGHWNPYEQVISIRALQQCMTRFRCSLTSEHMCQDMFLQMPETHELSSEAAPSRTKCPFVEYGKFSAVIEKNDDLIIENKDISLTLFLTM